MIQKIQRNDHRDQHIQIILADEENSGCFLLTCLITASSTAPAGTLRQVQETLPHVPNMGFIKYFLSHHRLISVFSSLDVH